MFTLNGKPLSLDRAFTTPDGVQYPANWLRLATPEQKAEIGIEEVQDEINSGLEVVYDQRFYYAPGVPRDHQSLVEIWINHVKTTAGDLLSPTDWYIIRHIETGAEIPPDILTRREEIRNLSNEKETMIASTNTTEELANYVVGVDFNRWEQVVEGNTTETV